MLKIEQQEAILWPQVYGAIIAVAVGYRPACRNREAPLSWCDKLASTPTVGIALDPYMAPPAMLLSALTPVLNSWGMTGDTLNFQVENTPPFGVAVTSNLGLKYGLDPTRLSIEFVHQLKIRTISGGPPTAVLASEPLPFTTLLPQISDRLIEATMLLPSIKTRHLRRVGIVSTTFVDEAAMPPGIRRFIEYVGRPWGGSVGDYNIVIRSELGSRSDWTDRCLHSLIKAPNPEQLAMVQFDWHRIFPSGRAVHVDGLREVLDDAREAALSYFEDLAEGSRFDENILRDSSTA